MEVENYLEQHSALEFITLSQQDTQKCQNNQTIEIDVVQKQQKPKGRFDHLSWVYKDKIYIFGGSTQFQKDQVDEQENLIYCFDLNSKKWSSGVKPRVVPKSVKFQGLSSMASAQNNNKVYIFGGSNHSFQCNQDLFKLDLQTLDVFYVEQRGQIPSKRQGAKMTYYDKNWLILYGGINCEQMQIYNDFYFFNVQARTWYKIQGAYQYLLSYRDHSSLIYHPWNRQIYLFGGCYYNSINQKSFLNDLYQLTVVFKSKVKPNFVINKILPKQCPSGRSGQSLTSLNQRYLILIGGQAQLQINKKQESFFSFQNDVHDDVWIFSIENQYWIKLFEDHSSLLQRFAFSCCPNQNSLLIFGGLDSMQHHLNDLIQIKINIEKIDALNSLYQNQICRLCWQETNQSRFNPFSFSSIYIDQILRTIQYPFAAFGLLIDNAVHFEANRVVINYNSKADQESSIKIQYDPLFLPFTSIQLVKIFNNIGSQDTVHHTGSDKKMKNILGKKRQKIQFCNNIMMGALRLGSKFLWVGNSQTQIFFLGVIKSVQNEQQVYKSYFYSVSNSTFELIDASMEPIKEKVQKQFGMNCLKPAFSKKSFKNYMLIFQLKKSNSIQKYSIYNQMNFQLVPSPQFNTLFSHCGNPNYISSGYFKNESIDANLSVYLSHLYLNSNIKILMSICGIQYSEVNCQKNLQKIDRLVKTNDIIQVDSQFLTDFDCNFIQIYYNPSLNKNIGFYSNGLLFYHKNRLIFRHQVSLGCLGDIVKHQFKHQKKWKVKKDPQSNLFPMFGFIQLPEKIPINMFKTGCIYPVMLQKLLNTIQYTREAYYRQYNCEKKKSYNSKINIVDILNINAYNEQKKSALQDSKQDVQIKQNQQNQNQNKEA